MSETVIAIPTLETERLRLRAPKASDFEAYADFRTSPRALYAGGPFSRAEAFEQMAALVGHWLLRGYGRWMVAGKGDDRPLGVVGLYYPDDWLEPEIAWAVFAEAEGKGIAQEAARASLRYAYETLGWTTAVSLIDPANTRSAALAERLGATREGVFHHPSLGAMDVWRHPGPGEAA
ncbi:MAG: GNAT family N-acetyltransferase [Paracoccaceae bacterium]|jgi:ribosomal-protein-alanine N-acetyltransferase|nr:GNAT family N-acetyltransferase [Paracoccaceae bacterium]